MTEKQFHKERLSLTKERIKILIKNNPKSIESIATVLSLFEKKKRYKNKNIDDWECWLANYLYE